MHVVKTPESKTTIDEYQIVQYPDPTDKDPNRKVFFADKKVKKRFLFFFSRTIWETVKFKDGTSFYWHDFKKCTSDIAKLKKGEKLYR